MSRTAIAPTSISPNTGGVPTFATADAANGMLWLGNSGVDELQVLNGDNASKTVTARSVPCSHGRTQDVALVIAAGKLGVFPKLDPALFNQVPGSSDAGAVYVDFSAATSVTVAVVRRA